MEIFICGSGRSGTSIYSRIIGLHKDIWSFKWESQIFSGLPALCDLIDSKHPEQLTERFSDRVLGHLYKRNVGGRYDAGLFELLSEEYLASVLETLKSNISSSVSEEDRIVSCRKFSDAIFSIAASKEDKNNWCEKTPRNLLYADLIQAIYPDAKFINLIRDGRDVVSSIVEKNFWPIAKSNRFKSTRSFGGEVRFKNAVDYWVSLMEITDVMRTRVGPKNWLDIRLEDLSASIERTLRETECFLGVDYDPVFSERARKLVRPRRANSSRFKDDLTGYQLNYLLDRQFDYLKRHRYI